MNQSKSSDMRQRIEDYARVGKELGLWPRAGTLLYHLQRQVFRNTDFKGKTVLDAGCSNGKFSAWAALQGATRVVGIEPMASGSGSCADSNSFFQAFSEKLELPGMEFHTATLEDFDCPDDSFDIVFMLAMINHIDEEGCIVLKESESARENYRQVFRKLHSIMKDGGRVIITDACRKTLASDLGLERDPFDRMIHFIKHQQPEFWAGLLSECGFSLHRISWLSRSRYRQLGAPFRNKLTAYLLALGFRLEMICHKPPRPTS